MCINLLFFYLYRKIDYILAHDRLVNNENLAKMRTNGLLTNSKTVNINKIPIWERPSTHPCAWWGGVLTGLTSGGDDGREEPPAEVTVWVVEMSCTWIELKTGSPQRKGFEICSLSC